MKKVFILFTLAFLTIFPTFAHHDDNELTVHSLHLAFPTGHNSWGFDSWMYGNNYGDVNFPYFGTTLNWNRITIKEQGFTNLVGLNFGFCAIEPKDFLIDSMYGFTTGVKFGWGYSPIHNDKFILALHGVLAVDLKFLTFTEDYYFDDSSEKETLKYYAPDFSTSLGFDAVFAWRVRETFALFAGLDVTTNFFGVGSFSVESKSDRYINNGIGFEYVLTGLNVIPRFGICWVF